MGNEINEINQQLLTIEQAKNYMKCSNVFLWQRRKEGKIQTVHANSKVLIPKTSIDAYLGLNNSKTESNG